MCGLKPYIKFFTPNGLQASNELFKEVVKLDQKYCRSAINHSAFIA